MTYKEMRKFWGPGHNNYYPSESFVRALSGTHPNVVVRWCNDRQRWELLELIEKQGPADRLILDGAERCGRDLYLMRICWCEVEDPDPDAIGDYLPLGHHLFQKLYDRDVQAQGGEAQFLANIRAERQKVTDDKIKQRKDWLYDFSRSAASYLRKVPEHMRGY